MKWKDEEFEKAVTLLKKGFSYSEIGLKINRGEDSVRGKLQKSGFSYREEQKEISVETRSCLECNKDFEVKKTDSKKFCSRSCSAKYNNKLRVKKPCGNCKNCDKKMKLSSINRNGFNLRVMVCETCNNKIVHPEDLKEYENFTNLRKKNFRVKLRFVGNSYAVSIPREIIDFMNEQQKKMNEMVDLSFDDFRRISLNFWVMLQSWLKFP